MVSELELLDTRAVKDEVNPAGYCLNCIKKHSAMAHGLFVEVEQRAMQGAPLNDKKIREKMSQAFEQMVHIEDHTIVKMPIDHQTRMILSDISTQANRIRAKLKEGEWSLDVEGRTPLGDIDDLTEMRLLTKELQRTNDKAIVDFGCGDCKIERPRFQEPVMEKPRKKRIIQSATIRGNNLINNDEYIQHNNGGFMNNLKEIPQKVGSTVGGTVDKALSFITEPVGSRALGLDANTVSEILNPQILASLSEGWLFDLIFSPGLGIFGQSLIGAAMMVFGTRVASTSRGKSQVAQYGAALAGRILRAPPGEISAMINQLTSLGRMALSNPRGAALAPFRTPEQIRAEVNRRTGMPGLRLGNFGLGIPSALQATDEIPADTPAKRSRFRIA